MSRGSIMSFLSVNQGVTSLGAGARRFRLPRMSPFPKLDGRVVHEFRNQEPRPASRPMSRGAVIIGGQAGSLPEMTSDVIDVSAGYAAENVKRDRLNARIGLGTGLGQLVSRMLGGHRAARV